MSRREHKRTTLGIRRGIPVALLIIFSSALFFQVVLFNYALKVIWRNNSGETLSLLGESLTLSMREVQRESGSQGALRFAGRISKYFPHFDVEVIEAKEKFTTSGKGEGVAANDRKGQYQGRSRYFMKDHKGVIVLPLDGGGGAGKVYSFEFDFPGRAELDRMSIIVAATSFLYALVLFIFTYFVFRKKISMPLSGLLRAVGEIEGGNESARVDNMPPNELGRLGDVINSALDSLEGKRRELEEIVGTLRNTNEELTKSRAQVIRAEKMATIGRLSSGIAHEVGNPLMAIKGYAAHLLKNTGVDDEQRDCLKRVGDESHRIEGILKGLLAHTRINVGEVKEADVAEIISDIIGSLSYRKIFEKIEVLKEITPVPMVQINPEKLRQVLLNLIMNSIDSIPSYGTLTIRTYLREHSTALEGGRGMRRRKTDPPKTDFTIMRKGSDAEREIQAGQFVIVEVSDTGMGIKEEDKSHIFDPFFTTKDPGEGTGLGLSVTSAILSSYGGHITFDSQPGEGSVFRVFVPVSVARKNRKNLDFQMIDEGDS